MEKIKHPSVAGSFYSSDKHELLENIHSFTENNIKDYNVSTRAIIVPHAGYYYSGQVASEAFQYLDKKAKNIFIFAPVHQVAVSDVALSGFDKWLTPLGEISLNQELNQELIHKFACEYIDLAFENEHSIEVQVPFIQSTHHSAKIVPVLVGGASSRRIADIIEHFWGNPDNAFVISSDLSHFYNSSEARKIDSLTAEMIESLDIEKFHPQQACGSIGVCALVDFAKDNNFSLVRIDMRNSADVTGETQRVVGYGSWFLLEGSKSKFIKKHFSKLMIDICRKSIEAGLNNKRIDLVDEVEDIPAVLDELGACFVTLEIKGMLRGCIGSIIAHQSLLDDLIKNAHNAAFSDTRFTPLTKEEFKEIDISVSLLSPPTKMDFEDEQDLLNQIKPFTDGIIIKDGVHQAVYLPSVWEQLPDKVTFLNSLKEKAGLGPSYFSKSFEAYRFTAEHIS